MKYFSTFLFLLISLVSQAQESEDLVYTDFGEGPGYYLTRDDFEDRELTKVDEYVATKILKDRFSVIFKKGGERIRYDLGQIWGYLDNQGILYRSLEFRDGNKVKHTACKLAMTGKVNYWIGWGEYIAIRRRDGSFHLNQEEFQTNYTARCLSRSIDGDMARLGSMKETQDFQKANMDNNIYLDCATQKYDNVTGTGLIFRTYFCYNERLGEVRLFPREYFGRKK